MTISYKISSNPILFKLPDEVRVQTKPVGNRVIKLDITWSYVKRQTAKMTSEFVFFSSSPSLNHIKIEKNVSYFSPQIQIFSLYCLKSLRQTAKVSFLTFAVSRTTT